MGTQWGPGDPNTVKVPMGTRSQMGTHVGEVYMALIWDLHGLGRISMGFLSSCTAMRLVPGAAKVPQHVVEEANCVQNLGLGYIEVDQQTDGRLKVWCCSTLGSPKWLPLFLSIGKSSRPRKAFLSSRLVSSAASPTCQLAGSSVPSCN